MQTYPSNQGYRDNDIIEFMYFNCSSDIFRINFKEAHGAQIFEKKKNTLNPLGKGSQCKFSSSFAENRPT